MGVHRLNILILNEDITLINKIMGTLHEQGFDTQWAHTFADARKLMTSNQFDVLVTDMTMPEDDGLRLTKSVCGQMPIVLLTSGAGGELMARRFEGICDCFLDKADISTRLGLATWKAFKRFKIDREIVRDMKMAA